MEQARMPKPMKTFASLQAGRAVAALMVVLYHCYTLFCEQKYWHHSWKKYLLCGHRGVEFFFVLSGIVILNAHWADWDKPEGLMPYVRKRFLRIYPIYWIVLASILPVFQFVPSFGTGVERQPSVILSSIILVHLFENATILTVAWTLYHEVMFYIVFAFFIINRRLGTGVFAAWMLCSVWALISRPTNPLLTVYTSPLHLLFGFGMGAMLVVRFRAVPIPRLLLVLGLTGFIAACVHENLTGVQLPIAAIWYGLNAAIAAVGVMELERAGKLRVPRILGLLGDASYSIYLVHLPLLSVMAKIIYPLWLQMRIPLIVPFLLMAVSSVALGVLAHILVERPLLNLMRTSKKPVTLAVLASGGLS
jgi:exopolysaccharide production protein ExoZ